MEDWRLKLSGKMKDEESKMLHQSASAMPKECQQLLERAGTLVTDLVLHNLLWGIEQCDDTDVVVKLDVGELTKDLSQKSDGFSGELYSDRGWVSRFSREKQS